jgi:sulfatase maturation enzyme AslB (radical SAM superfamily)
MATSPLFVKYETESGGYYFYDPGTNEIVRIGGLIYTILDDFQVLTTDEILQKYDFLGERNVREALAQINRLQSQGILCVNGPEFSWQGTRVVCQGKEESLRELLCNRRHSLTLEITQQCNLRCEYCCYGEHYPELRGHAEVRMSPETALRAVRDYMDREPATCHIAFYGGEPLLEFALLKQVVLFAEDYAKRLGIKPEFSITTNGTLLRDEIIRFLVEHAFRVMVSLDGAKESHDRYRVFRKDERPDQKRGSYDVIMRNLRRFVELFPEYPNRGIAITITATSDYDAINEAMKQLSASFFLGMVSRVRSSAVDSEEEQRDAGCHIGSCGGWACGYGLPEAGVDFPEAASECHAAKTSSQETSQVSKAARNVPEFRNWTQEQRERFVAGRERFVAEVCRSSDADAIRKEFPLFFRLFWRQNARLHLRPISRRPAKCYFTFRCFPGAARTFCSSQGALYPCEKTQTGALFCVGDATDGLNVDYALRLVERLRLISDCANCVARRLCPFCPAEFLERADSTTPDSFEFRTNCQGMIVGLPRLLKEYTTIMEANPDVVERLLHKEDDTRKWVDDVRFLLTEEQQSEVHLPIEELEPVIPEVSSSCQPE